MKKIDVGQTVQIVANIGVIASIIFLGVQLRDGSIQARRAGLSPMYGMRCADLGHSDRDRHMPKGSGSSRIAVGIVIKSVRLPIPEGNTDMRTV